MSEKEIRADMLYHISISIAKSMLENNLITDYEYAEIDTIFLREYRPYLGTLLSQNSLTL